MNGDVLLIVLTDNYWLYAGLSALLPEMVCRQAGFCSHSLPREVRNARRVIIAVDCRILFSGVWTAFNALKDSCPGADVIWLVRKETGRLFPLGSCGNRVVHQRQDVASLRLTLQRPQPRREEERVAGISMTLKERQLLPLFLADVSVPLLSRLTGKSVKTLYVYRHKILLKTGFRQLAFLQFVYERNRGLPGILGLDFTDNSMPKNQVDEETGECIA